MKRKHFKKVLAISLCATTLVPAVVSAKEFKDVKKNGPYGWAYSYIDELSDKGIIKGYDDGEFKPDIPVSFEETLQLIKGLVNPSSSDIQNALNKYGKDCEKYGVASWAKEAAAIAIDKNIITVETLREAQSKSLIDSSDLIYPNRNSIVVYYARALNLSADGSESYLKHNDKDKIPRGTKGYLASLIEANVFSSTGSDGNFEGDRYIRRSEMAKITKASYDYLKSEVNKKAQTIEGKVIFATNINNLDTIIIEKDSKRYQFRCNSSTTYKMNDKSVKFSDIKIDQEVKIEYVSSSEHSITGTAKSVEIKNTEKDLIGYVTSATASSFTVKYRLNDKNVDLQKTTAFTTTDSGTFELDKDVKLYKLGYEIKTSDLSLDDMIEFKVTASGKVKEANVYPKNGTVKGKVVKKQESRVRNTRESIVLKLDNGKEYTFYGNVYDDKNIFYYQSMFENIRNDEYVTLTSNYKIIIKIGSSENNKEYGEVSYVRLYDRFDNRRYRDSIGELEIDRKTYYLMDNTKYYINNNYNSGIIIQNPQYDKRDLRGKYVELVLDGDRIVSITEIDKNSYINAIAQITDVKIDPKFGGINTFRIKVLDKDSLSNIELDSVYTFTVNQNFDRYEIVRIKGYMLSDGIREANIERMPIKVSRYLDSREYKNYYKNY